MAPPENRFFNKLWVPVSSQAGQPGTLLAPNADPVARMSNIEKLGRTLEYARSAPEVSAEDQTRLGRAAEPREP